jgi:phosphate transport system substrate-binding protein
MSTGFFPRYFRIVQPGGIGRFAATALILTAVGLLTTGCVRKERHRQSTPTSGSLVAFAAPAIAPVVQIGADQFNRLYSQANINVYPLESRAIVDSMIQGRTNAAYFDRRLAPPESLAIVQSRKHIYSFLLGITVATWLVHPENSVSTIDSLQLRSVLSGSITSWKELGGADDPIHIYLPALGDGAWEELMAFFDGALSNVQAHNSPSDSAVLAQVQNDPLALGLISRQISPSPQYKKLKWVNPILADPVPANIGTLQEGKYPFKIGLYYYTIADQTDLASGFLSFLAGNQGQRLIADHGFLPAMIPVIINISSSRDQK